VAEANVEALQRGYEALNRGDLSVVLELLHPDLEWHEPGDSPEAGSHRGRDGFERFFRGWIDSFDQFRVQPEQVVERGNELVAVVRQSGRGRASGVEIEIRIAHVWTVENGRAIRWEAVPNPDDALAR
jgi:uncharacterized protein